MSDPHRAVPPLSAQLEVLLANRLPAGGSMSIELGDVVTRVPKGSLKGFLTILKNDRELSFDLMSDITAVDWLDGRETRFEIVYHLMSIEHRYRIRVKAEVSEAEPSVPTVTDLWKGANFLEREVWDMMGISFTGHPDLRRILMYDEFVGHPLRKDYPLQAKQPRIPLLYPEVENTARQMIRPSLVAIGRRGSVAADR